jgi:hypothetical protein
MRGPAILAAITLPTMGIFAPTTDTAQRSTSSMGRQ